jgi:hypothetical protein
MKKAEVVIVADDDDELRTSVSENPATATLCTEEFFLRTQYLCIALHSYQQRGMGGGDGEQDIDGQHDTYGWSWQSWLVSISAKPRKPYRTGFKKPK